jgi:hypothetical protein
MFGHRSENQTLAITKVILSAESQWLQPARVSKASSILGVNERTLRRWEETGKIQAIRRPSGQRKYNVDRFAAA